MSSERVEPRSLSAEWTEERFIRACARNGFTYNEKQHCYEVPVGNTGGVASVEIPADVGHYADTIAFLIRAQVDAEVRFNEMRTKTLMKLCAQWDVLEKAKQNEAQRKTKTSHQL